MRISEVLLLYIHFLSAIVTEAFNISFQILFAKLFADTDNSDNDR